MPIPSRFIPKNGCDDPVHRRREIERLGMCGRMWLSPLHRPTPVPRVLLVRGSLTRSQVPARGPSSGRGTSQRKGLGF